MFGQRWRQQLALRDRLQGTIISNDPPYDTERLYDGLRLAHALIKRGGDVCVFLMGDAVSSAEA